MENFVIYNPTSLHFGKHVLTGLGPIIKQFGKKVLLIYGTGSVKRSGLYDNILKYLHDAGITVVEYGGIKSNPVIDDVEAAARVGRENQVEVILAVGGGSVIDSAKVVALTIPVSHPAWDFFSSRATPQKGLPIITVLTLAATGSEMNPFAVISNHRLNLKSALRSPLAFPKHSFLDPEVTMTVPRDYTAYGVADLIAHCMEAFFGAGDATLSDRFTISIIREAMTYGPRLLENLHDYDLRARIMYAATMALNGMTICGRISGDWGVHAIGHVLSLLYDVPHGASLTIVYPAWMRFFKDKIDDRLAFLGTELFNFPLNAGETIDRIEEFFRSMDCPVRLSDLNIPDTSETSIVEAMEIGKVNGMHLKINPRDYHALVKLFL
ncbi:MAG: iron-containing alcohol dehydrogenase [bacterium]